MDGEPVAVSAAVGVRRAVPGRQDRRSGQHAARSGTHIYELRYTIPGVLDPGSTGENRRASPRVVGDPDSTSAFFWNVIAPSWNNVIQRVARPRDAARRRHRRAVLGRRRRRARRATDLDGVRQHGRVHAPGTWRPAHRSRCAQASTCRPRRGSACRGPTTWDRILGRSVDGRGVGARPVASPAHWSPTSGTAPPSSRDPGFPVQYAPAAGSRAGADRVHPHRGGPEERADGHAVLSRRAQAGRPQAGQRQAVERPRHRRRAAWADVDPVSVAVGSALEGDGTRQGVRGQEDRQSRARSSPRPRST